MHTNNLEGIAGRNRSIGAAFNLGFKQPSGCPVERLLGAKLMPIDAELVEPIQVVRRNARERHPYSIRVNVQPRKRGKLAAVQNIDRNRYRGILDSCLNFSHGSKLKHFSFDRI